VRHYQSLKSNGRLSDFTNSSVSWMNKVPPYTHQKIVKIQLLSRL
jgi:hypothetical protein